MILYKLANRSLPKYAFEIEDIKIVYQFNTILVSVNGGWILYTFFTNLKCTYNS